VIVQLDEPATFDPPISTAIETWTMSCVRCRMLILMPAWAGREPAPITECPFCRLGDPFDALVREVRRRGL
jgi:hypothetical protein